MRVAYLTVVGLVVALLAFVDIRGAASIAAAWAVDIDLYLAATRDWLAGGPFYEPWQLAGPYRIMSGGGAILYPPVALWLFVPFTVLPLALWWAVPLAAVAWAMHRLRPSRLAWPLLAALVVWPPTLVKVSAGNPVMWCVAALAIGTVTVGPAVFVLLKPSLAPFALWGFPKGRWLACFAVFALLCVPFGTMWGDWSQAVTMSDGGAGYSLDEVPMMLIPVVAYASSIARQPRMTVKKRAVLKELASGSGSGRTYVDPST